MRLRLPKKIYHLYLISDRLCVIVDHLSHNRQSTSEKFRRLRYIPYVFTPFVEMNFNGEGCTPPLLPRYVDCCIQVPILFFISVLGSLGSYVAYRYKKRRLSPAITTHILNMPDSCAVRGSLANSQSTYIYYLLNVFLSLALLSGG